MDDDAPLTPADAKSLRFLKGLVTVLTATMILGVLTIVVLLVIRLQDPGAPALPEAISLPAGTGVEAFTQGSGWYAVVTDDGRILIFDAAGEMLQEVEVEWQ